MSSLKLFGIPFERIIGIIGNAYIITIVSVIFSIAIDFQNIGLSKKIGLDISAIVIIAHFFGFFIYQIVHLLIGRFLLNNVDPIYYRFLAVMEFFQLYFTILYFHNPFISMHWDASEQFAKIFKYSTISFEYSVYSFLGTSFITTLVFMCSKDTSLQPPTERDSKQILGMSYKTCETLIYWLSFFSFIPTIGALLFDFILIINFPYINKPSNSQVFIGVYYATMIVYQYGRFISLLFPCLDDCGKRRVFWEIFQLVLSLGFFFNPYRETNKTIYQYFKYTTIVQTYVIPILFFSLFFNSLVYFILSRDDSKTPAVLEEKSEEESDSEEDVEYKVLGGKGSTTKIEKYEHPNGWLKRRPTYQK